MYVFDPFDPHTGQKAASAAEASRGYFGHNFPLSTLEEFVGLHRDGLTEGERELIGASSFLVL